MAKKRKTRGSRTATVALLFSLFVVLHSFHLPSTNDSLQQVPRPSRQTQALMFPILPGNTQICSYDTANVQFEKYWQQQRERFNYPLGLQQEKQFFDRCVNESVGLREGLLDVVVTHVEDSEAFRDEWIRLFEQEGQWRCPIQGQVQSHALRQSEEYLQQLREVLQQQSDRSDDATVTSVLRARLLEGRRRLAKLCFAQQRGRFRSWGELRYVLRSIDMQWSYYHSSMPFSRRVFLVVPNESHVPKWVRGIVRGSKLIVVPHADFISLDALPTFNSNVIESLLHRIPGLSRYFVYFNNDMLWGRRVSLFDYFRPVPSEIPNMLIFEPLIYSETANVVLNAQTNKSVSTFLEYQVQLLSQVFLTSFGSIHYSFAHYPRLFHRPSLERLSNVLFPIPYAVTRRHHLARQASDVWVPYLYDAVMIFERLQQHRYQQSLTSSSTKKGHCPVVFFYESNENCGLGDTNDYRFLLVRTADDLLRATEELSRLTEKSSRPLFWTLNDDVEWQVIPNDMVGQRISSNMRTLLETIVPISSVWEQ